MSDVFAMLCMGGFAAAAIVIVFASIYKPISELHHRVQTLERACANTPSLHWAKSVDDKLVYLNSELNETDRYATMDVEALDSLAKVLRQWANIQLEEPEQEEDK